MRNYWKRILIFGFCCFFHNQLSVATLLEDVFDFVVAGSKASPTLHDFCEMLVLLEGQFDLLLSGALFEVLESVVHCLFILCIPPLSCWSSWGLQGVVFTDPVGDCILPCYCLNCCDGFFYSCSFASSKCGRRLFWRSFGPKRGQRAPCSRSLSSSLWAMDTLALLWISEENRRSTWSSCSGVRPVVQSSPPRCFLHWGPGAVPLLLEVVPWHCRQSFRRMVWLSRAWRVLSPIM